MTTKEKGNIGESQILLEFLKRGIQVSIPFGDNARYDLVADFGGKLNKIQVKYCDKNIVNGGISLVCSSSKNHTTNRSLSTYVNDVDYFAFYVPKWEVSLLVPIEVIGDRESIKFRMTPAKNNQKSGTHFVQDYLFDTILGMNQ